MCTVLLCKAEEGWHGALAPEPPGSASRVRRWTNCGGTFATRPCLLDADRQEGEEVPGEPFGRLPSGVEEDAAFAI